MKGEPTKKKKKKNFPLSQGETDSMPPGTRKKKGHGGTDTK